MDNGKRVMYTVEPEERQYTFAKERSIEEEIDAYECWKRREEENEYEYYSRMRQMWFKAAKFFNDAKEVWGKIKKVRADQGFDAQATPMGGIPTLGTSSTPPRTIIERNDPLYIPPLPNVGSSSTARNLNFVFENVVMEDVEEEVEEEEEDPAFVLGGGEGIEEEEEAAPMETEGLGGEAVVEELGEEEDDEIEVWEENPDPVEVVVLSDSSVEVLAEEDMEDYDPEEDEDWEQEVQQGIGEADQPEPEEQILEGENLENPEDPEPELDEEEMSTSGDDIDDVIEDPDFKPKKYRARRDYLDAAPFGF